MAIDFPNTPTVGQTFTSNGRTWQYTSADVWDSLAANTSPGDFSVDGSFTASNYDVAGKNKIINGAFDIWQRYTGVAFTASFGYCADRWIVGSNANQSFTRQLSGVPGFLYSLRCQRSSGSTANGYIRVNNPFATVNSIPLAGQTVTLSFYAKRGADLTQTVTAVVQTGTGTDQSPETGYTGSAIPISLSLDSTALTTSWVRYSVTGVLPANTNELSVRFWYIPTGTAGANEWFEITGVQLERGSVATPFSRAGGTYQGELDACKHYYQRWVAGSPYGRISAQGASFNMTTAAICGFVLAPMRVTPTSFEASFIALDDGVQAYPATGATMHGSTSPDYGVLTISVASGLTTFRPYVICGNNNSAAYVAFSAEL